METHNYIDGGTLFLVVVCAAALVLAVTHCIGWMRDRLGEQGDDLSTQQLLDSIRSTRKGKR